MKCEGDFLLNTNVKQFLEDPTRIILLIWSDMPLASVWIYNSMYLTHFPSKRQLAQVCMRVSILPVICPYSNEFEIYEYLFLTFLSGLIYKINCLIGTLFLYQS